MHCLQLLLLAKAVAVALLADEIVLPGQQGECGLLAIYLAVCCSIIGLVVQYYSAESLVSGRAPVVQYCFSTSHQFAYADTVLYHGHEIAMQIGRTASELKLLKYWSLCLASMTATVLLQPATAQTSPVQSRRSKRQKL